jgi:hypothetical protein
VAASSCVECNAGSRRKVFIDLVSNNWLYSLYTGRSETAGVVWNSAGCSGGRSSDQHGGYHSPQIVCGSCHSKQANTVALRSMTSLSLPTTSLTIQRSLVLFFETVAKRELLVSSLNKETKW